MDDNDNQLMDGWERERERKASVDINIIMIFYFIFFIGLVNILKWEYIWIVYLFDRWTNERNGWMYFLKSKKKIKRINEESFSFIFIVLIKFIYWNTPIYSVRSIYSYIVIYSETTTTHLVTQYRTYKLAIYLK